MERSGVSWSASTTRFCPFTLSGIRAIGDSFARQAKLAVKFGCVICAY
jgi:hypothetical protein